MQAKDYRPDIDVLRAIAVQYSFYRVQYNFIDNFMANLERIVFKKRNIRELDFIYDDPEYLTDFSVLCCSAINQFVQLIQDYLKNLVTDEEKEQFLKITKKRFVSALCFLSMSESGK